MSKIINFKTDNYTQSAQIPYNKSKKIPFTEIPNKSCLAYQLGDWQWNWSQIESNEVLEPETDYLLRFAVYGGYNDTQDSVISCAICADGDWDMRKNYDLAQFSIEPVMQKKCSDGVLRVYEIPFTSGKSGDMTFVFSAVHAQTVIMPAFPNESYSEMKDTDYDEWWATRQEYLALEEKNKARATKRRIFKTVAVCAAVFAVLAILCKSNDKCKCKEKKACDKCSDWKDKLTDLAQSSKTKLTDFTDSSKDKLADFAQASKIKLDEIRQSGSKKIREIHSIEIFKD